MSKQTIYIHNAMQALPGFWFNGIEDYATRALTQNGGVAVIPSGLSEIDVLLSYYHSLGIGVDDVIELPVDERGDLYPSLYMEDAVDTLRYFIRHGFVIEFFNTRDGMEEMVITRLGLDWDVHTVSLPSSIAMIGNNKALVRLIAECIGCYGLFPPHVFANSEEDLFKIFARMVQHYGHVVIKPPSWASGLGMIFGHDIGALERFRENYSGPLHNIIVEQAISPHQSMTIVKQFVCGAEVDSWVTTQDCLLRDGSVSHIGSVLGDIPLLTEGDRAWMQAATAPLYHHFLAMRPRLTGTINWDCIKAPDGRRYILEGNFRVTFSTYIRDIQRTLAHTRDGKTPTCCMRKVEPDSDIRTFADLTKRLGEALLRDPCASGVIPIVVPCLPRSGYCYFVAVGSDYDEATSAMQNAVWNVSAARAKVA